MPATYSWDVAQHWLNLGGWKGMPLLHTSMFCGVLFFCLFFLSSFQTEQFQRIELLLWQDLASTMMKHQINSVSWPNLIFPEIQSPTSNAFLKLHCRLRLRAKKMSRPWFSRNGLLHCGGYRLENSKDTIYIKSLWMYTVQHILWPYCQFIPTLSGSLLQYTKKKQKTL